MSPLAGELGEISDLVVVQPGGDARHAGGGHLVRRAAADGGPAEGDRP
jgi:hypothetical protein